MMLKKPQPVKKDLERETPASSSKRIPFNPREKEKLSSRFIRMISRIIG